jgi:hypothetical protein
MGSKSNHSDAVVVMMKDELEKIKEQVLNVLCCCHSELVSNLKKTRL